MDALARVRYLSRPQEACDEISRLNEELDRARNERDAALQRAEQAEVNMRDRIRETEQDAKLRVREAQHNEDVAARAMNEENDRHIARIVELEAALAQAQAERWPCRECAATCPHGRGEKPDTNEMTGVEPCPHGNHPMGCMFCQAIAPPALPPLPEVWEEERELTVVRFTTQSRDTEMGVMADRYDVRFITPWRMVPKINVSDLITVLRHAEAAHLTLKGGSHA